VDNYSECVDLVNNVLDDKDGVRGTAIVGT